MSTLRYYKGVRLGHPACAEGQDELWYRLRTGREFTIAKAAQLPPDWVVIYCLWYQDRGLRSEALELRERWLAAGNDPRKLKRVKLSKPSKQKPPARAGYVFAAPKSVQ